jgi:hypothetical protein
VESVSASGKWTPREFRRVQRREYRVGWHELVLIAGLLVYGWIFGYLVWDLVVGIVVYAIFVLIVSPFALWRLRRDFSEERAITLNDVGVSVVSKSMTRKEEWANYKGTKERSEHYALQKTSHRPATIILKRFFVGQEAELRAILRAHTNVHFRDVSDSGN